MRMTGTTICWRCSMCRAPACRGEGLRGEYGICQSLFDAALPIRGVAGDQQAAAIGQGCSRRAR